MKTLTKQLLFFSALILGTSTVLLIAHNSSEADEGVLISKETYKGSENVVENRPVDSASPIRMATSLRIEQPFKDFVLDAMKTCETGISRVRQEVLAEQLAVLVPRHLDKRSDQELFIVLLCMENNFKNDRKSPVGAVGIAQVMPQYAQNFADLCGLGKLGPGDVEDTTINLTLGLCYYKHLLSEVKYPTLVLAAYNAGAASSAVKSLKKLGTMNLETANYVARAAFITEKMNARNYVEVDAGHL